MKASSWRLFCVLLFVGVVAGNDVVELTDDNFDASTQEGSWFLKFYAPWCGHCKRLAPTWDELATKLKGTVNIAKVDCTVHQSIAARFGIRGYPTLIFLKDGFTYDYNGQRSLEDLAAFAEGGYTSAEKKEVKSTKPKPQAEPIDPEDSDVVVLTKDNFYDTIATGEWLVEFYAPWCGHCKRLAPIWEETATKMKGKVGVAKVDATEDKNRGLSRQFDIGGFPTIKYFKDGKYMDYKGKREVEAFEEFAKEGYKTATAQDLPFHFDLFDQIFDGVIDFVDPYVQPYEAWILEHVGTIIISMTFAGLLSGLLLGKLVFSRPVYIVRPKQTGEGKKKKVKKT